MFVNCNNYDFGKTSGNDTKVDDVILPKWAKTADDFVRINRQVRAVQIFMTKKILFYIGN